MPHRPFNIRYLAQGLILPIAKYFCERAIVRESREGSTAGHLDRKLATSRSTSPEPTINMEPSQLGGLTAREIGLGEVGVRCTKPNRLNQS